MTHWLKIGRVQLWEAVALSMDIDPKQGNAHMFYDDFVRSIQYDQRGRQHPSFVKRLETAEAHVRDDKLDLCGYGSAPYSCDVNLANFARWADSVVKWETP